MFVFFKYRFVFLVEYIVVLVHRFVVYTKKQPTCTTPRLYYSYRQEPLLRRVGQVRDPSEVQT